MLLTKENVHAIAASFINLTTMAVRTGTYPQYIGVFEKHKVTALRTVRRGITFYDIQVEGESICEIDMRELTESCHLIDKAVEYVERAFSNGCYSFIDQAIRHEITRMIETTRLHHWEGGIELGLGLSASKYRVEVMSGTTPFIDIHCGNELVYSAPDFPNNYSDLFVALEEILKRKPMENGLTVMIP